ncbi:rho guanine nucleotide exchange factor 33 isoform X2 [Trichomycterus rosablanca]
MENGQAEDTDTHEDEPDLHMVQLQALWAELKAGLRGVVQGISTLQQNSSRLEEQVSECQRDAAEKILSLRNTLNTVQEETSAALTQISELSIRQKELRNDMEQLHRSQHRKFSRGEELVDGFSSTCSQTHLNLIQHYISSLPTSQSSEQDASGFRNHSRSSLWKERRNSRDVTEQSNQEMSQRQVSALELLESERVYVSYLSLLLKANISYNGSENSNLRDKRPFPSSLRFLIQQHLELLQLLQDRVLRSHWQGIMGDVFLRLTSKENDFLENYVSYLKELPECLNVVGLFKKSSKLVGLLEGDTSGDETHPSLHTLLLQPVQRIPEYLGCLQNLLRHTESEHPDYYLLLVCVQHLRSFTSQYSDLFQHNQELLSHNHTHSLYADQQDRPTHSRKEHGRSSVKQLYKTDYESSSTYSNSSALTDPVHGVRRAKKAAIRRYPDWESEPNRFHPDIPFPSDSETRHKAPSSALHRIPETDRTGSALADAMEAFLPYKGADSHCSSASHSTDSSIDIAFVRCSPSISPDQPSHERGRSRKGGAYRAKRGHASPDSAGMMMPRPLQAVQRKSKSLNGLQIDNTDSHQHPVRSPVHQRLVRQSSARTRLTHSSPERCHETHAHVATEELAQHLHRTQDSGTPVWEELKWKTASGEADHAPLSERSRKEGKGFRSSFKKLFRKM